jgi:hypothetical protein
MSTDKGDEMSDKEDSEVEFDSNWFALERNTNATRTVAVLLLGSLRATLATVFVGFIGLLVTLNQGALAVSLFFYAASILVWLIMMIFTYIEATNEFTASRDYREVQ